MTIHKMASEVGGRREKMNWGGKEKQPGRIKSWLVPSQLDLGEEVSTSEQLGWISSFNPWQGREKKEQKAAALALLSLKENGEKPVL